MNKAMVAVAVSKSAVVVTTSERFRAVSRMYDSIMHQDPHECYAVLKMLHKQGGNDAFIASISASATHLINKQRVFSSLNAP